MGSSDTISKFDLSNQLSMKDSSDSRKRTYEDYEDIVEAPTAVGSICTLADCEKMAEFNLPHQIKNPIFCKEHKTEGGLNGRYLESCFIPVTTV